MTPTQFRSACIQHSVSRKKAREQGARMAAAMVSLKALLIANGLERDRAATDEEWALFTEGGNGSSEAAKARLYTAYDMCGFFTWDD